MQITEADRLDMLAELRRCHGERVGNIIVAHLPPVGWGDIARAHDIARLEQRIDASDAARAHDIARLDKRIDNLGSAMWAMGGITAAGFISMFTLVATKL
ncbi:MAG: hypothetical protein ACK49M_02455 [Actinomycetes bacterium]|jgi:hypothetical protein